MMIEKLICDKRKTLLDALQKINTNAKRTVFIVDDEKRLCGILTDGDIRRLLLGGHNLQESIEPVLKKDFVYVKKGERYDEVLRKVQNRRNIVIPIISEKGKVIEYIEYKDEIHLPIVSPHLKGNELKYLVDAFLSTWISSSGQYIREFEKKFSDYCGCKYGIAVSNGTVALHLALMALGIGEGDEVIVPDFTFAATVNAVLHSNATPVMVDVEEKSWCIDPERLEKAVTKRTKAVIPVHLYGQPCNMQAIVKIAKRHSLRIIEDCAEAHGATYDGKKVGSFGDISCFSFFGNKIITTGEGGMCITNDEKLMKRMTMLRDHGMSPTRKYWHEDVGYNYRMTNLQAAIGIAQLERIGELLAMRQGIENTYRRGLKDVRWLKPQPSGLKKRGKVTWYVNYLIDESKITRYRLIRKLKKHGFETRPFFYPVSKMNIYKRFTNGDYPVSHRIAKAGISLPTNLNLSREDYQRIISVMKSIGENPRRRNEVKR